MLWGCISTLSIAALQTPELSRSNHDLEPCQEFTDLSPPPKTSSPNSFSETPKTLNPSQPHAKFLHPRRGVPPRWAHVSCQAGDKKKFVYTGAITAAQISQFIEEPYSTAQNEGLHGEFTKIRDLNIDPRIGFL